MEKPRQIAARILMQPPGGHEFIETLLDRELEQSALAAADRGLLQELTFGVVRWRNTLDWLIARKTPGRHQKHGLQVLLRLALYQLFWLDRIPDHAAVHETVELAKQLGFGPQAGFVNAVLRGCLREREATERLLEELKAKQPALGYSHPDWLCARWQQRWGEDGLRRLLAWNNTPPPTYARLNLLRATPEQITTKWEQEGVGFEPRNWDWTGGNLVFELTSHPALASLESFRQGLFYVQDPSTLLAVRLLDPQPGETILDLCAAPGGKTLFMAQLMQNRGSIVAQDPQLERRRMIWENCQRLGVTCARLALTPGDGQVDTEATFDRVLVDAPCSNTGVMRRRVELRWRVQMKEIQRLRAMQLDLLRRAARHLTRGGCLGYSTCSLEPEENGSVVQEFLAEHPGFRLVSERELVPHTDRVDGAYVARLVKS